MVRIDPLDTGWIVGSDAIGQILEFAKEIKLLPLSLQEAVDELIKAGRRVQRHGNIKIMRMAQG